MIVPLPSAATHLACGDNHTVVLLQSGEVFTFGRHQEGQLGRKKGEEDDETWHMVPRPVPMLGEECKATWVGASGNQTFIAVDESLVSESALSRCKVFASPQAIGEGVVQYRCSCVCALCIQLRAEVHSGAKEHFGSCVLFFQ